ncbi:Protoporphyrinogen oxidase [Sparassis crispa]|uniref:Protoporphyrinogen oxidase n=1 Tax=Sparassis crispa TaxID=139825 RepID=A0A401GNX2_9APHY|nr:Protoporphyrinogen oxidase [Sparassis crispa]GBE83941.1 Protoporphyrinogen oxidase [Sparassis crispa]
MAPTDIVILGGGITGLSSAFHLARRFPDARITLLEKDTQLGGFLRSERVQVEVQDEAGGKAEASVLLEGGPRTVRPVALAVLELVNLLDLTPSLVIVSRKTAAARNRFLHLPGTDGLSRIPSSLTGLLTTPLGHILLPGVLRDAWRGGNGPAPADADESVASFLGRRFGPDFARTFGSAFVHGVYAADSRVLSVRAAFPDLPQMASKGSGSVVRGALWSGIEYIFGLGKKDEKKEEKKEYELGDTKALMKGVSVFSLRDGLGMLITALETKLGEIPNVTIVKGDAAVELSKTVDGGYQVKSASGATFTASHLVSALPLPMLSTLVQSSPTVPSLPHLTANGASTVALVNFIFPCAPSRLHPPGFGYLVPRPSAGYNGADAPEDASAKENPIGLLGTVFDSCALADQDTNAANVTKVTAILGGPYLTAPAPPSYTGESFVPDLLKTLEAQLSLSSPIPEPLLVRVHHHTDCIPTLGVGHLTRMEELKGVLEKEWNGRLEVIGAGVGGVSVGACVESGRNVGTKW